MTNSLSSSDTAAGHGKPVSRFDYRDMTVPEALFESTESDTGKAKAKSGEPPKGPAGPTAIEIEEMMRRARAEAVSETEKRLRGEYEAKLAAETAAAMAQVKKTLELFSGDRKNYFSRVEADVVQLALSIAGKILHREAQVDPLLLTALIRVAVEKLQEGSKVAVRVAPAKAAQWRQALAGPVGGLVVTVIEDMNLTPQDCILETDMGAANFSVEAQLKEIEQGFFDLLSQRPS